MLVQNIDEVDDASLSEILSDSYTWLILESVKDVPKNISQICLECKIPASTTYRKVQKLSEYRILHRMGKINQAGKRENWYKRNTYFAKISHLDNC